MFSRHDYRCALFVLVFGFWIAVCRISTADEHEQFFESQIRPLLVDHCLQCHGPTKQSGELRLDSREHLLHGGASGLVIRPGKPDASPLIQAVRRTSDLAMPPDEALTRQQVDVLEHWVQLGAPWPKNSRATMDPRGVAARSHWAFQPVRTVDLPTTDAHGIRNAIDAFIIRRLEQEQLALSPAADARTLIRRATMGLTGLPPSSDDVEMFTAKDSPAAWVQLIDDLLGSSGYGEQWARHWQDIARYSDTKGYVYAREERKWVHAWSYRDWVIASLNSDMSFDRFLLLQLAADQVPDRRPGDLAAMGFLTLGRRFLGVTRDIMDDRIDTITRGTMGLTVACARCHDHKYDPIPTTDYYALYGVLHSCKEQRVELPRSTDPTDDWQRELETRHQKFRERYNTERLIATEHCRDKLTDYLRIQDNLDTVPAQGFDQVLLPDDILPAFVRRWDDYLRAAKRSGDPVFRHWHAFAEMPADQFARNAASILTELQSRPPDQVNPCIAHAFPRPPRSFSEVIDAYTTVLATVRDAWREALGSVKMNGTESPTELPVPEEEQLRQVLYGPQSPCQVPDESLVHTEYLFTTDVCGQLWELQKEIDYWLNSAPHEPPFALTLADRSVQMEPRVFRRGNPKTPGEDVPRRFLSVLTEDSAASFQSGSGRLELAKEIISPDNPLTARVIVNRIWGWHFGRGLVATPSDFGIRAGRPSHPDLLDWLTRDFIEHGWSLKHLHRRILLSATYRQSSAKPTDPQVREHVHERDPSNRLLWRMPLHRLTFEEFRDSILTVSGELNRRPGGRPHELFAQAPSLRRTIYGEIDRQFFPAVLRVFDVANPDIHIPHRRETTVPQQALFYMNHSLVQDRARQVAASTSAATSTEGRIQKMFQRVVQRSPSPREIDEAMVFVTETTSATPIMENPAKDWSYLYGKFDEEKGGVIDVRPIPHFTGTAWQGGAEYPDPSLGRVQLTGSGGHPGKDHQLVCIRRWTAPRDTLIAIKSKLVHEAESGDGIRAFLVSSRAGQLAAHTVRQQTVDCNIESLSVAAGETIDFVVDNGEEPDSDQFLQEITIRELGNAQIRVAWNSRSNFTGEIAEPLHPWEQLAHVLLCSNEFLFVD